MYETVLEARERSFVMKLERISNFCVHAYKLIQLLFIFYPWLSILQERRIKILPLSWNLWRICRAWEALIPIQCAELDWIGSDLQRRTDGERLGL